ncbi:hypothetical protein VaNZ11_015937 [Volvox africanus]|uniref:Peptidase S8/S53 domain-containing protein n=1 Tax=Volvox africanus TaxID=51714 RepID=A0ABQ5SMZ5_9CHLO|nr:hypothetical protein VaNZ11_015937 [Volvox africanus]
MAAWNIFLFAFPACTLAWALLALNSYAKVLVFSTGQVELRPVSKAEVDDTVAAAAADTTFISSGTSRFGAVPPGHLWGDVRLRRAFIVSYEDATHGQRIVKGLQDRQASILSYIPENNVMVSARRDVAFQVAFEHGAELAECDPNLKIAAELQTLIAASSSSSSSSSDPGNTAAPDPAQRLDLEQAVSRLLGSVRVLSESETSSPQYGVLVELQPGIAAEALQEAEQEWPRKLAAAVANTPPLQGGSSRRKANCQPVVVAPLKETVDDVRRLSIFFCKEDLAAGLIFLAGLPEVKFLTPLLNVQSNNGLSSILIQTGDLTEVQYTDGFEDEVSASYRPYWKAGLQGKGEVLGLGDTGLDIESCYFTDPFFRGVYASRLSNESSLPRVQGLPYWRVNGHRKVAQYTIMKVPYGQDQQLTGDGFDRDGHGTQVSGCLAGAMLTEDVKAAETSVDSATGAAPKALISFIDLSNETRRENSSALATMVLPTDLAAGYLAIHQAAGASIISNSWTWASMPKTSYLTYSRDFDRFLWKNPGLIAIHSAGNEGNKVFRRPSIGDPGVAKNVVTVGAGTRMSPALAGSEYFMYKLSVLWRNGRTEDMMFYPTEKPNLPLLKDIIPDGGRLRLVMADPLGACKSLRRLRLSGKGAVVLVTPPTQCDVFTQARRVVEAGGKGMLVLRSTLDVPPAPVNPDTNELFTMVSMAYTFPEWTTYFMSIFNNESLVEVTISKSKSMYDSDMVMLFSATGPMPDGRMKPDIIAPGFSIVTASRSTSSATSTPANPHWDSCLIVDSQQGTSFSTPLVAGNIAIMRQYFRNGFYPSGDPKDSLSAPFTPSGMLLKGLIIAGAKSLEGGVAMMKVGPMGSAPDGFQGWGRMSLSGALPLPGFTDPDFRLQVADWGSFSATGESAVLDGLNATGTGAVKVVLVYYDFPGETMTSGALVNNLDLLVEVEPGGRLVLGNQPENATKPRPDSINPVERVLLTAPAAGSGIRIIVNATSLPSSLIDQATTQRWAVAVVGHFEGTLRSPLNPAWAVQRGMAPQRPNSPPQQPDVPPPSDPDAPLSPPRPGRPLRRRPPSPVVAD